MVYKLDDLSININKSIPIVYGEFHNHQLDNNTNININGGGNGTGRSEHGSAHFDIRIDNVKIEIYLPGCDDYEIPNIINKLEYKKNKLNRKDEKRIIKLLTDNNMYHLIEIAKLWNIVNKNNKVPGLKKVQWV